LLFISSAHCADVFIIAAEFSSSRRPFLHYAIDTTPLLPVTTFRRFFTPSDCRHTPMPAA